MCILRGFLPPLRRRKDTALALYSLQRLPRLRRAVGCNFEEAAALSWGASADALHAKAVDVVSLGRLERLGEKLLPLEFLLGGDAAGFLLFLIEIFQLQ